MLELPTLQPEPQYVCPGEDYAISRAVHLSRLAAFYPKCRECVHRNDTAQLAAQTVEKIVASNRRAERATLFTDEGVRGVYLNELTAKKAGDIAGAFASLLWELTPLEIREPAAAASPLTKRLGPTVVIAHDDRPSSPDLITGVAKILRRMGCHVIDIGLATRPCFWFAVDHLQTAAGIQVAGFGHDPAWTGLDFVGPGAIPIERDYRLPDIAARQISGYQRPLRLGAGQRTFHCGPVYEAGLRKHFHALRPLKVCLGCPNRTVRDVIVRLFQPLACQLVLVPIPVRARQILNPDDIDLQRMRQAVPQAGAHFGLLINDDGQTCAVFDERGEMVAARQMTLLLAEVVLSEARHSRIVVEQSASTALLRPIDRRDGFVAMSDANRWSVADAMREADAVFAGGDSGRYWFRETMPTCDAVLTLAKLLQALSRSDAELSLVVAALK
jgi:phosphomannomutase